MSKNKLYNQSYFVKRILDAGFFVTRLNIKFEKDDYRRWMILVNSKNVSYKFNICITCFKKINSSNFEFKFQGQNNRDFYLSTKSMSTIINILNQVIKEKEKNYFNNHMEEDEK
jgi:hypothetical protein